MVTSTVLLATEFCIFLCARYDVIPPNLQNKFDICATSFYVSHGLIFINRGLAIAHRNKVRDKILYLA